MADISKVIEYLNRAEGTRVNSDYYANIAEWRGWWQGFNKEFHEYREKFDEEVRTRQLYSLKMAKKICEDWASILMNEKTYVNCGGDKAAQAFLTGDKSDQTGGIFGESDFWAQSNALVEKAFMSGTGAFSVDFDIVQKGASCRADKIYISYFSADQIIPISVKRGKITEAAFVSSVMDGGKKKILVEMHRLNNQSGKNEKSGYKITKMFLSEYGDIPELISEFETRSTVPLFAVFSPNIVSPYDNSNGLGVSVFAHAIDEIKAADYAFNNFVRDFKLGGKKVFYAESLTHTDPDGKKITPDDTMQQLFFTVEGGMSEDGGANPITEYNPTLRVDENARGVQEFLNYLSFKCGLGTKRYQFTTGKILTATEYSGDKQDLIQNAHKHMIPLEAAIKGLCAALLWAGRELQGLPLDENAEITVDFSDGFVIDEETARMRDLQEFQYGIITAEEFRNKWGWGAAKKADTPTEAEEE